MKNVAPTNPFQRLNYTKQDLGTAILQDNLNHITIDSFCKFRDQVLVDTFKKYFPIQSKKDSKRTLSLKKVIINQPTRSFEAVYSSLGSYDFSVDLVLTYTIRNEIKLPSISVYKTHLDALCK